MENKWLDPVIEAYRTYFGPGDAEVVIDVGTRDGDDAEFLREKLNAGLVIAIDANPIAAQATRERYPEMTVFETAISDYKGSTKFLQVVSDNKDVAGCSSMDSEKVHREEIFQGISNVIEVPVRRLDDVLQDAGLSDGLIDVVKIDIEGFTYQALIGMGDGVKRVKVFHLETERVRLHRQHRSNTQIAKLMQYLGFALVDVSYEWGYNIQDQVWVNTKLFPEGVVFRSNGVTAK